MDNVGFQVFIKTTVGDTVGALNGLCALLGDALGDAVGDATAYTTRIRLLKVSPMYILPDLSIATPAGSFSVALVARMLSPLYPAVPFPAIVVIIPVHTVIIRRREVPLSAK